MARTNITRDQVSYPWDIANATALKAKLDDHDTAADAGTLAGNALAANPTGRAAMAAGYFDAATVALKFAAGSFAANATIRALFAAGLIDEATATSIIAAQAINGALLKNATVTATQLAANAVTTVKILDANVTQAKIAPSSLDGTVMAVGAEGNTLGMVPINFGITVTDGSTVQTGQTLDATYSKIKIDDVYFIKGGSTGGETDAVQLCTDVGGTTAVSSSLALNTVAAGGIVRTTSLLNNTFAAGAIFYVKRTHTTDCSGIMVINAHRVA